MQTQTMDCDDGHALNETITVGTIMMITIATIKIATIMMML